MKKIHFFGLLRIMKMIYDHAAFDVEKGFCKATFYTITMLHSAKNPKLKSQRWQKEPFSRTGLIKIISLETNKKMTKQII